MAISKSLLLLALAISQGLVLALPVAEPGPRLQSRFLRPVGRVDDAETQDDGRFWGHQGPLGEGLENTKPDLIQSLSPPGGRRDDEVSGQSQPDEEESQADPRFPPRGGKVNDAESDLVERFTQPSSDDEASGQPRPENEGPQAAWRFWGYQGAFTEDLENADSIIPRRLRGSRGRGGLDNVEPEVVERDVSTRGWSGITGLGQGDAEAEVAERAASPGSWSGVLSASHEDGEPEVVDRDE